MSIFKMGLDAQKTFDKVTDIIDKSNLTAQEKADKTLEGQERLGITPSSKTRRYVTWLMLIFLCGWFVAMAIIYKIDQEWSKFMLEAIKEFCSNWVIITIISFFYLGYYAPKVVSNAQKNRLEKKAAIDEIKIKEKELDLEKKEQRYKRKFFRNR